ncbi:MAG: response regulator, partial [Hafnia sp.]
MPDKKSRVLIVDDAPENIRMLVESLKENYVIMVSKDGESALRLALAEPSPDCIILDVVMPGMDGYEVCRRLKESRQTRDIPVIFITSQSDELDEARGLALGAVDYITKPFRSTLVMTRIANQIELKQHRDSLSNQIYERTHELALTREVTIEALATLAEWRDPETGGHIKRTQSYVRALAEQLHIMPHYAELINDEYIELLYLSAPLHDVGKVSMPDDILLKPASLTPDEFAE